MNVPRFVTAVCVSAFLIFFPSASGASFQQQSSANQSSNTTQGVEMYKRGETKRAIEALRVAVKQNKEDADAWHYLGLALNRDGKAKDARKAFQKSVELRPKFAPAHVGLAYTLLIANKSREAEQEARHALALDSRSAESHYIIGVAQLRDGNLPSALGQARTALNINPAFAAALLLKSQALFNLYVKEYEAVNVKYPGTAPPNIAERKAAREALKPNLVEAADSMDKLLKLNPNAPEAATWREQLETFRIYAKPAAESNDDTLPVLSSEVTTKAVLSSKPEPSYTEAAREACVDGVVKLRLVLASDGTVKHILPLKSLSHGLTEKAIAAARKIKFVPATKNGRPASQWAVIEYSFNCY